MYVGVNWDTSKPRIFEVDENTINNLIGFATDVIKEWVKKNNGIFEYDTDKSEDDRNTSYFTIKREFTTSRMEVIIRIVAAAYEGGGRKNRKNKTKRKRNNKQRKSKKHNKQSKRR